MSPPQVEHELPVTAKNNYDFRPELFLHGLLLGVSVFILLMSFLMHSVGERAVYLPGSSVPMPEVCTTRILLGMDCPGCGLTRSFIAISHGQLQRAWQFNPGGAVVYVLVLVQIPWQIFQIRRLLRRALPINTPWLYAFPAVAAAALIIQWLAKTLN